MIVLDYKDRRPIYEQVMERLQELMLIGVLGQDEKLPSVRSLATELSINPNTIQRAYMELERQGYIYSVKGKGSFVADLSRMKHMKWAELESGLEEIAGKAARLGVSGEEFVRLARDAYGKAGESV
ncbi:MAG TPA: GntR family transcriptional regulator [Candidatus Lachnoclostridium pullistercoris]|uniref:GntR family transcriptional regulator n=1 Tax=Candidatus Lachnoclostridium pullistercoris TaxID=2838632 RepID=A0A9D2PGI4_9FIRM|nr:GntR family transcriptional regulator [Candidatus Lachnoclostridium pullistercoris]